MNVSHNEVLKWCQVYKALIKRGLRYPSTLKWCNFSNSIKLVQTSVIKLEAHKKIIDDWTNLTELLKIMYHVKNFVVKIAP